MDYLKAIPYAAHHLQLAILDENGYHFAISQDMSLSFPGFPLSLVDNLSGYLAAPLPPAPLPTAIPAGVEGGKEEKPRRRAWTAEQLAWAVEQVGESVGSHAGEWESAEYEGRCGPHGDSRGDDSQPLSQPADGGAAWPADGADAGGGAGLRKVPAEAGRLWVSCQ